MIQSQKNLKLQNSVSESMELLRSMGMSLDQH